MTRTVAVADFEAHSLELLDEVATTQEEIVVTKEGKPVAKLVPLSTRRRRTLEELRGSVTILGDIVEPLDEEWDVMK